MVFSHRRFFEVYSRHRSTIDQAVTVNELGTAFCYARALYLAYFDLSVGFMDNRLVSPQTHLVDLVACPISCKEAKVSSHFANTARGLEDHFSLLCVCSHSHCYLITDLSCVSISWKDCSSKFSKLLTCESYYFQRAFYRFWIVNILCCRHGSSLDEYTKLIVLRHINIEEIRQFREYLSMARYTAATVCCLPLRHRSQQIILKYTQVITVAGPKGSSRENIVRRIKLHASHSKTG